MAVTLKIEGQENLSKEDALRVFDEEVEKFSSYMANLPANTLGAGPLSTGERALVKSYLVAKYRGKV